MFVFQLIPTYNNPLPVINQILKKILRHPFLQVVKPTIHQKIQIIQLKIRVHQIDWKVKYLLQKMKQPLRKKEGQENEWTENHFGRKMLQNDWKTKEKHTFHPQQAKIWKQGKYYLRVMNVVSWMYIKFLRWSKAQHFWKLLGLGDVNRQRDYLSSCICLLYTSRCV